MTNEQLWQTVLGELELTVSRANFITWLKNTSIASIKNGEVIINVPNGFAKEWLENKYNKFIIKALKNNIPGIKTAKYIICQSQQSLIKPAQRQDTIRENYSSQIPQNNILNKNKQETGLNSRYTFNSFVVGSSNELAYAACIAVTKNSGTNYNPLFIYGESGLGKTHLLQSIGNEILKANSRKKIHYTNSEIFTNQLITAISEHKTNKFKNYYREIDVLIIDDIQFLAGKEKTQEEFFHTFNSLYEKNKQIVLSSDRMPKAIPTIEERLRSRFEGGMIADIGFPDFETRLAILNAKLKEKEFEIPQKSMEYIATHIQRNIRELEGALNRVIVSCQLNNLEPNIKNTTEILSSIIADPIKKTTTSKEIIKEVAEFYDIGVSDLVNKCRKKEIVKPRQIAMYLMRKEIKASYPNIGEIIGKRDHSTAMHAYEKIESEIENDKQIEQEINLIKERIYN